MNREDIICPGETIKELLEVYNYTQQDLANKLQMDLKTVNEIYDDEFEHIDNAFGFRKN